MHDVRLPEYKLAIPIEVRFRDLDAMGHVNNAVYFTYFEQARTHYWLSLLEEERPVAPLDYRKIGFILVHASCDYASPAEMGEPLLVGCRVTGIGRSSFALEYRIVSAATDSDAEARLVATGKTIQALYDWEERKTIPFSDDLRRRIEAREGAPVKTLPK